MTTPIRVLIVDDELLIIKGIEDVLKNVPDVEVVGTARSGEEAIAQTSAVRPDVVLMDLRMPGMGGINAISALLNGLVPPKVISLTTIADDETMMRALEAGSQGYILKEDAYEQLAAAIRTVMAGDKMLSPSLQTALIRRSLAIRPSEDIIVAQQQWALLSPAEQQVARLVAEGLSNRDIAEKLYLSESTVKSQLSSAQTKMDKVNRTQVGIVAALAEVEL